jgi:hypothetical protein
LLRNIIQRTVAHPVKLPSAIQRKNPRFDFLSAFLLSPYSPFRVCKNEWVGLDWSNLFGYIFLAKDGVRMLEIILLTSWDHSTVFDIATINVSYAHEY